MPSTPRLPRSAGRCTSATSSPIPTPTSSPASSGCAARRSSIRWAGTTTACPRSAASRTTSASAAIRRSPMTRSFEPPAKAERADPGLPAQLHRALPPADPGGREGLRGPLAAPRPVDRLDPDLCHDRRTVAARLPAQLPRPPGARHRLQAGGPDPLGRGLPHRRGPGRDRGPRDARRLPPPPLRP